MEVQYIYIKYEGKLIQSTVKVTKKVGGRIGPRSVRNRYNFGRRININGHKLLSSSKINDNCEIFCFD